MFYLRGFRGLERRGGIVRIFSHIYSNFLPFWYSLQLLTSFIVILQHTPKFSHQTPSHLLSPAFVSSPSFLRYNKPTYTTYELRYRFHPKKPLFVHPPFSFHVFLGPIPTDASSEAWFNSTSRIGGHGISASHDGGVSGIIPLTRTLLEKCGTLEVGSVLPYLRRELRWVVEKVSGLVFG